NALSMLDTTANRALFWVRSSHEMPYFERAAPLRTILHLWFGRRGLQLTHAAAVGTESGGVILVGKAGAGKSTTALACLESGLGYAADDYCLIAPGARPTVHSIYGSAKTTADALARLPFLGSLVSNPRRPAHEKALHFLHERFAARLLPSFPLKAVLVPRVAAGAPAALKPVPAAEALLALAPSTILQLPGAGADALRAIGDVVRRVPCYRLDLGLDLARVPSMIAGLLGPRSASP